MKCGVGNEAKTEPGKGSIYFIGYASSGSNRLTNFSFTRRADQTA